VGKKPLYYTVTAQQTCFRVRTEVALQHPKLGVDVNLEALDAYFTLGYVPDPLNQFRDVHKLPPGHYLVLKTVR